MKMGWLVIGLLFIGSPTFAKSISGKLEKIYDSGSNAEDSHFVCSYQIGSTLKKIDIVLKVATRTLEVELENDILIRGTASETIDRKKSTTYYFVQGGSAPLIQRLTLAIRDGAKWARFTKAYGADEIVCDYSP